MTMASAPIGVPWRYDNEWSVACGCIYTLDSLEDGLAHIKPYKRCTPHLVQMGNKAMNVFIHSAPEVTYVRLADPLASELHRKFSYE